MLENGTVLKNRYRITGQLGVGGTSYVYLAVDLSIQKWWAVKQILYKKEVSVRFAEQEVLRSGELGVWSLEWSFWYPVNDRLPQQC